MNCSIGNSHKSLVLLPILAFAAPVPQAVASPRLSLEAGGQSAQSSAGGAQLIAQVIPASGATNTQVSVDSAGQQFEISGGIQAGENLFHHFNQLDLEAGQTAHFLTAPAVEAIFSQISGAASSIDGRLKVSGSGADLFLLNPSGIVFGPNARLELGGSFVATTADRLQLGDQWIDLLEDGITAQTALAESLNALEFSLDAAGGAIANQGQLAVTEGQSLGLLGSAVINTGSLTAPDGEVTVLAATPGQRLSLGGGLLNVDLPAVGVDEAREYNLPIAVAQSALGEATGLSVNADNSVSLQAGKTVVSGLVDVSYSNGPGGQARVLGNEVRLADAVVDASGASGGVIHVGGDYQGRGETLRATSTQVDSASVLHADGRGNNADTRPDGGEVIVWADGRADFAGTATARSLAPGGDGGLVETSGKQQLAIAPTASVSTTAVDGVMGQWLLDPVDLTVDNGGGGSLIGGVNPVGVSSLDASIVEAGLNGNNVSLQADNSIQLDFPIDTSSNPSGGNLFLDAPRVTLTERVTLRPGSELSGTATLVSVSNSGSIQNAVDTVVAGGRVALFGGATPVVYREGQEIIVDKPIVLDAPGPTRTTISGDANGDGNAVGNQSDNHRIISLTSNAAGTVLSGIKFSDAIFNGEGGALLNNADDVMIEDSIFIDNKVLGVSADDGGAIHSNGQRLRIEDSQFNNNFALSDGGAIAIELGSVEITSSTFSDNVANSGHGGAIDLDPFVTSTIVNSIFERNASADYGGAIAVESDLTISGTDFLSNTSGNGGAVGATSNIARSLDIADSRFESNTSTQDGGAVYLDVPAGETLSFFRTDFLNNNAVSGSGGGVYQTSDAYMSIRNSLFERNMAGSLGGAIFTNGSLNVNFSRVLSNTAATGGGGLALGGTGGFATISSTTVNGNTSSGPGGGFSHVGGQTTTITDSTFSSNLALGGSNGGALDLFPSVNGTTIQIENSTISSNVGGDFGGGIAQGGTARTVLNNVTVSDNISDFSGGGLANPYVVF